MSLYAGGGGGRMYPPGQHMVHIYCRVVITEYIPKGGPATDFFRKINVQSFVNYGYPVDGILRFNSFFCFTTDRDVRKKKTK